MFQETQPQEKCTTDYCGVYNIVKLMIFLSASAVHPILRFAQDMQECRKIQFAKSVLMMFRYLPVI